MNETPTTQHASSRPGEATAAARTALAASLRRREPTWRVADDILRLGLDLPTRLQGQLQALAATPSWDRQIADDFDQVIPATAQLETFIQLFPQLHADVAADDPDGIRHLITVALQALGAGRYCDRSKPAGFALRDFHGLDHRHGIASSRKALHKRLRFLRRLEQRADALAGVQRLRAAQMQAKSRCAHLIEPERCDDLTLAFCAYLAARANRRSLFMLGSQSKAQDEISAGLEKLLRSDPDADWSQVALVKPTRKVIDRLSSDQQGRLIGLFHQRMADSAAALADLWPGLPDRMHNEMVMVKGVDSSRWNAYAGSLNTMRSAWISALGAAGMDNVLDAYCPGKAPRLMASDLVWWYREDGQELHEDTRMFNALPHPWDVISGRAEAGRDTILIAAAQTAVDADASGWIGPRHHVELEKPFAELALVHGVVVADPDLAVRLRHCGVFSGKQLRDIDQLPDRLDRVMIEAPDQRIPVVF